MTDDEQSLEKLSELESYKRLLARRTGFGWILTACMLAAYFGFIALVAFDKPFLARPIAGGAMSLGIPVGLGLVMFTILITWIYVRRANSEFDQLTQQVREEAGR